MRTFFELNATSNDGKETSLSEYRGNVVLVVNTASKCGFTGQYKDLEKLHEELGNKGLIVLGFPSNDFMGQEPGTDAEIKTFCELNYEVNFPLFAKAPVKGEAKQEVFKFLTAEGPEDLQGEVRWNFEKFLIDRKGNLVGRWRSITKPSSKKVRKAIEAQLGTSQNG